ncbi:DUF3099 domain-containing protein [Leucobacter denitrificans]|uniref:DUF3099 domain-containing protein n=1 Tax=Leucobacter denitrificans TaxID=683042 RepID=A0A7G9S5U9_9MICO|nr:DUF3099 domain-containing protein [Leucobacter denitrificans]QNN63224.1 DUF3099 domain-containing protein [Leucobacter denitrificans]
MAKFHHGAVPSYSVTSAGVNPVEDRAYRMRMYFIAMSLRVVCVGSLFWVRGWWIVVPVIGSIVLPWFAVMIGNAVQHGGEVKHDLPEPYQLMGNAAAQTPNEGEADQILIVDVDPVRRSTANGTNSDETSVTTEDDLRE